MIETTQCRKSHTSFNGDKCLEIQNGTQYMTIDQGKGDHDCQFSMNVGAVSFLFNEVIFWANDVGFANQHVYFFDTDKSKIAAVARVKFHEPNVVAEQLKEQFADKLKIEISNDHKFFQSAFIERLA